MPGKYRLEDLDPSASCDLRKYLGGNWDATSFILWYGYNWSEDDRVAKKPDPSSILNDTLPDLSDIEHDDDVDISDLSWARRPPNLDPPPCGGRGDGGERRQPFQVHPPEGG